MNSVADVWTNVLQQLKKDLSETTITTWFDELTAVDIRENTFYLHCPNDFKKTIHRIPVYQKHQSRPSGSLLHGV
ncbi:MAG: DnaA N-terminal domain-containing protein [Dysosmobacter sp.]